MCYAHSAFEHSLNSLQNSKGQDAELQGSCSAFLPLSLFLLPPTSDWTCGPFVLCCRMVSGKMNDFCLLTYPMMWQWIESRMGTATRKKNHRERKIRKNTVFIIEECQNMPEHNLRQAVALQNLMQCYSSHFKGITSEVLFAKLVPKAWIVTLWAYRIRWSVIKNIAAHSCPATQFTSALERSLGGHLCMLRAATKRDSTSSPTRSQCEARQMQPLAARKRPCLRTALRRNARRWDKRHTSRGIAQWARACDNERKF